MSTLATVTPQDAMDHYRLLDPEWIDVSKINRKPELQPRGKGSLHSTRYAQDCLALSEIQESLEARLEAGGEARDPIWVYEKDGEFVLTDGHHTTDSYKNTGRDKILALVNRRPDAEELAPFVAAWANLMGTHRELNEDDAFQNVFEYIIRVTQGGKAPLKEIISLRKLKEAYNNKVSHEAIRTMGKMIVQIKDTKAPNEQWPTYKEARKMLRGTTPNGWKGDDAKKDAQVTKRLWKILENQDLLTAIRCVREVSSELEKVAKDEKVSWAFCESTRDWLPPKQEQSLNTH